jgi:biotin carboxylase
VQLVLAEGTDRFVPAAAYINERLGLPGIDRATAQRFTNKYVMREALQGSGVCMPRYAEVHSADEAARRAENWGFPVVLKPKASQASVGVQRIDTAQQLQASFGGTMRESNDGTVLLEEFVDGPEVTVEAFSLQGRCCVLAVSEKEHYAHNPCVARRLAYPPRLPDETVAAIEITGQRVVEWLGLRDGLSHAEYRIRGGVPYLVEVAARGGGNAIASTIVPHVSGIDVYGLLIRRLLGESVDMPRRLHRAAVLEFLDVPPGTVRAIQGLEQIRSEGLVADIQLSFEVGDTIAAPLTDTARVGYFIALGDARDDIDWRSARVLELLRVEYA